MPHIAALMLLFAQIQPVNPQARPANPPAQPVFPQAQPVIPAAKPKTTPAAGWLMEVSPVYLLLIGLLVALCLFLQYLVIHIIVEWITGPMMVLTRSPQLNPENPCDENPAVLLEGRRAGLWGLLLSLVNLAPQMKLRVTPGEARLTYWSFYGESIQIISLQCKPSASASVTRPLRYLYFAGGFLSMALTFLMLGFSGCFLSFFPLVFAAGCVAIFYFGQQYAVRIVGFTTLRFRVRPGMLTGNVLSFGMILAAVDLIRRLIDRVETPSRVSSPAATTGQTGVVPAWLDGVAMDGEATAAAELTQLCQTGAAGGMKPVEFLDALEQWMARHPGADGMMHAGWERDALSQLAEITKLHRRGHIDDGDCRKRLRSLQTTFPDSVASAMALRMLEKK